MYIITVTLYYLKPSQSINLIKEAINRLSIVIPLMASWVKVIKQHVALVINLYFWQQGNSGDVVYLLSHI